MARYFRLSDAMPLLETILCAEKGITPQTSPTKPNKYFCGRCNQYHLIYSNIGNEHRDYIALSKASS